MCCTMTMPGVSAGRLSRRVEIASVPPVEAPMRMIFSVAAMRAPGSALARTASAVSLGLAPTRRASRSERTRAAALTASQMRMRDSARNASVPMRGLVMMSTAP